MARTKKQQETPAVEAAPKAKGPTWRIGLFRNEHGKLITVYVGQDLKTPQPYERKRVGDRPILLGREYSGIKYSEAREKLLEEAKSTGITNEAVKTEVPTIKPDEEPANADWIKHAAAEEQSAKKKPTAKKAAKPTTKKAAKPRR